ncbi:MAG: hypothetical protein ACO1Q7_03490, partial [Gemmatimonas sp.]
MSTRLTAVRSATIMCCVALLAPACKAVAHKEATDGRNAKASSQADADAPHTNTESIRHGIRVFVSAVNCEMNADDAARLNTLATSTGIHVEVVLLGITNGDTSVARRARHDLTLTAPTRLARDGELDSLTQAFKYTGGASLPVELVIRGRLLKTIVAGETMPRTVSLLEAA